MNLFPHELGTRLNLGTEAETQPDLDSMLIKKSEPEPDPKPR